MIKTDYWAKPIPLRQFDWQAVRDGYEPGCPIGYGRTEQDADLCEQAGLWTCDACGQENSEERDYLRCSCCHTLHPALED